MNCDFEIRPNVGDSCEYVCRACQRSLMAPCDREIMSECRERPGEPPPRPDPDLPCIHRGEVLRQVECKLCGDQTRQVEVFACDLHGECAKHRTQSGRRGEVRQCLTCPDRTEPQEPMATETLPRADVLMMARVPNHRQTNIRSEWPMRILQQAGIATVAHDLQSNKLAAVSSVFDQVQPRVFINRCFHVGYDVIETLAERHPETRFVTVNHSSQPYLMSGRDHLRIQSEFLRLARERKNCWLGLVDERLPLPADCERLVWIPNPVMLPECQEPRRHTERQTVVLAGRVCPLKNWPSQLIALAHVARRRPIRVVGVWKGDTDGLVALAKSLDLPLSLFPWSEWPTWIELLRRTDLVMQSSFTESFNYVGLDALSVGVPVIGSPALRYLPPEWQGNPDSPAHLEILASRVLADPPPPDRCRTIAAKVADGNNEALVEAIRRILT